MLNLKMQRALDVAVTRLRDALGDNLSSLVLYGGVVRGTVVPKVSDLNLLLVLRESTPEAHARIAEAIRGKVKISPLVLGERGLARSARVFALKFLSIRRHYQVLHGGDPLAALEFPSDVQRFLTEQALRNMRLRVAHAFIVKGRKRKLLSRAYAKLVPALFTSLSDVLRLSGSDVPPPFAERVAVLASFFGTEESILNDLLALKASPRKLRRVEVADYHARLFALLDAAVKWIEENWPEPA